MSVKVIKFYDELKFKPNKVGSSMCLIYETVETDEGAVYKKTNTFNRQAIMNSEAKNCDINVLYKRLIKGDKTVLETREGVYLDTSNAPKDIIEMNNYSKYIESYFNSNKLLKEVYNNDFNAYMIDYQKGLPFVKNKIDEYTVNLVDSIKKSEKVKSEVKENENK